ncbi:MAG: TIGR00296 family protein [Thermoplasmata archaeon]|nr:TIGR00296 family protein [Thermoplasmata archaeon]
MISRTDGERSVRLARAAIENALNPDGSHGTDAGRTGDLPPMFREPRGVFVTLRRYPTRELRGCIGFPLPVRPLGEAISEVAVAAATEDPRFPPVDRAELAHLILEVSILTPPVAVASGTPAATIAAIRTGRDGLIVEGFGRSGLLLPQVATEQGWDAEELLAGTCEKAGLPRGAWRDPGVRVRRFEAEWFAERQPRGEVEGEAPPSTPPVGPAGR